MAATSGVPELSISRRHLCGHAFSRSRSDAACRALRDQPEIVKETIAKKIIEAVKNGERDPNRLRDIALAARTGLRSADRPRG